MAVMDEFYVTCTFKPSTKRVRRDCSEDQRKANDLIDRALIPGGDPGIAVSPALAPFPRASVGLFYWRSRPAIPMMGFWLQGIVCLVVLF